MCNDSRTSLIRTPGDHQNPFVLSGVICIENASKGTEIVFVLTVFVLTRFYCILKSTVTVCIK